MVRGYYKGAAFYTDLNDLIHSWVTPVIGEEYYDIPTTLIYLWDGQSFHNSAFTTKYTYLDSGQIDTNKIYLARPGQRILGVLNGIDETTCSLTRRLNDTDELSFTVNRIVDGEVSAFYDRIERHYELYIPSEGWFKIVDEPELSNDGNIETKQVVAESYEIELQQYDLIDFYINTGEVYSREILATDNTYDMSGYSIPRDNVRFYRDTTELSKAVEEFKETDGSIAALATFAETHPVVFSSWRITHGESGIEIDATSETDTPFTGMEILERELERQNELSFLWLVLHEHNWGIGYVDPYIDPTSDLEDDKIPLADKVGMFEVDSQDIYSFLTQEAANYFRCIFVFDTKRRLVNAYNINNIGYDTNIFLSWHNVQNSVTRSGEEELHTVFRVSGGEDIDFTEANFGLDTIEDITYFLTTDHFSQEFIDKYNAWLTLREERRQQYIQLSKDYRNKTEEAQEIYTRVPADSSDTAQYSTFTDDELIVEKANQEALLRGYQSMYVDENNEFDEEAILNSPDAADYLLLRDIILSSPLDALDHVQWSYDSETHTGEYSFDDPTYRLGNIDIEIFNRRFVSGYYQNPGDSAEEKSAKISSSNAKEFLEDFLYDFDKYGGLYGVAELETRQATLKNQYQTLASKGFDVDDAENSYHHNQYLLYIKYLNSYNSCTTALAERTQEYDDANEQLSSIADDMDDIKDEVSKENVFTEKELELLDHYYIYTDYSNDNILTTSVSTNDEIVDIEDELYRDAADRLYVESHPQYSWSTTQDNLLLMPEFKAWHGQLNVGNFIRISMRDDWQVKLRVSEITLNPMMLDPTIDLVFTTMTSYKSKRNDAVSILGNSGSGGSSKNSITSSYASHAGTADTVNVNTDLIMKILRNGSFTNYMSGYQTTLTGETIQAVQGDIDNLVAQSMRAVTINVDQITGTTAQFQEMFSQYIGANYIATDLLEADDAYIGQLSTKVIEVGEDSITTIAEGTITTENVVAALVSGESGSFDTLTSNSAFIEYLNSGIIEAGSISVDDLKAKLATIDTLAADSAFVSYLQNLSSTTAQATITEAYIYNAVVGHISVADLDTHTATADQIVLISADETHPAIAFQNATQQFYDDDGNVRVQIGQDNNGDFNFIVRGSDGTTALFNENGITQNGIPNSTIVNNMISDSTIEKAKLNFPIVETNPDGTINITQIKDGTGGNFGVEYTTFKQNTSDAIDEINSQKMYRVTIESDNGNIFKNGDINCTLRCRVYSWDDEITDDINAANFTWTRKSKDTAGDTQWNANHSGGTKTITLTPSDVYGRSVFYCTVTLPDGSTVTGT